MRGRINLGRALRRSQTRAEVKVWRWLRDRRFAEFKFRRQYAIGPYVVDFYCAEYGLALELDGSVHNDEMRRDDDAHRDRWLKKNGITVLRISNDEIRNDPTHCADRIRAALAALTRRFAPPSPASGRGR